MTKVFIARRLVLLTLLVTFAAEPSLAKRKDDVVVMKNGDRFTGEIKGLQSGELWFKASYMASAVSLNWAEVAKVESKDVYVIVLTSGASHTGYVNGESAKVRITEEAQPISVPQPEVVSIKPEEKSFWKQLNGSLDYGFNFASANEQVTSSFAAGLNYYNQMNLFQVDTSSQFNDQSEVPGTVRNTFTAQYARDLNERYFVPVFVDLLKSDQQELNLRTTAGGGLGRQLLRTPQTWLRGFAGLVYTHENYVPQPGTEPIRSNLESVFATDFTTFRFTTLDLRSHLYVFPSLSDLGRVRISTVSDLKIELVKDFYFGFRVYENFDSRPPINAPKNDVGVTTSLGWKF
jgi:putative salt-induced outer membrane protein YdiY